MTTQPGRGRFARRRAAPFDLDGEPRLPWRRRVAGLAPGLVLLRGYDRGWLRADLFAGLAVAAYLVPQVMAYAAIVDLPPVTGLWTALAAGVVYALLGSSRVLSAGPESTVALMAAAAVAPLAAGDPARVRALTAVLCFVVAGWVLLARLARLGVVADLLSQPLLVGYLAGGAVLMVVGQLGRITGTSIEGESVPSQLRSFAGVLDEVHPVSVAVALGTLALLLAVRRLRPRWPAPLIAVATATAVSVLLDLPQHGVRTVGDVPAGLPTLDLGAVRADDLRTLALTGLGVAIVAYSDNTLTGQAFRPARAPGEPVARIDPQQELVALGGVHVATGLVGGFPISSSGSRTALAVASGAKSQLYSLVAAACVVVVLLAAGPLVAPIPAAVLGAVVLYAAGKLVSVPEFVRLARFRPAELVLAVIALVGTVTLGILAGVGVAIGLSVVEMVQRLARPHEGVLGRVPGLAGMHDVDDYPDATTIPGLVVYRYDAPLFFANAGDLQRRALAVVEQENVAFPDSPVRWFVLNVEANVEIDITAADGLRQLHGDLASSGVRLGLARVKNDLRLPLERAGLVELLGEDMLFPTLPVAEEAYLRWATEGPGRAG